MFRLMGGQNPSSSGPGVGSRGGNYHPTQEIQCYRYTCGTVLQVEVHVGYSVTCTCVVQCYRYIRGTVVQIHAGYIVTGIARVQKYRC